MRFVILALLLIAACTPAGPVANETQDVPQTPTPEPPEETPVVPDEPDELPKEIVEEEEDFESAEGQVIPGEGSLLNITCDPSTRELSFTILNTGRSKWQLDQEVGWPPPQGLDKVTIVLNSYEMNDQEKDHFDGEQMFGPDEPFSENCDGDAILDVGESTRCTVRPVPLKRENSFDAGTNELQLNAVSVLDTVTFLCE